MMKKIWNWIKSPSSDFALFILFLILLNIVGNNSFARIDLTSPKSYSLSKASKQLVNTLEEPLSVRVFFDENLPPPYNNTAQYIKDFLTEYKGSANKNFSLIFMDMSKPQNAQIAEDYGLTQIQIQEVKNNEVGFKQGYMGVVLSYGDSVELIDGITDPNGFEYKLTSTISKMINTADSLANLKADEKIKLTLIYSDVLKALRISGADELEEIVKEAYNEINAQKMNRIEFSVIKPTEEEANQFVERYGIQGIKYNEKGVEKTAALGLVLESGENFKVLPMFMQNSLFGYVIGGLDKLSESINQGIQGLVSKPTEIGYIKGHNELDNTNERYAANFDRLVSGMYTLVDLDLDTDEIPANMSSIIINGPQWDYEENELYKIDQFIMRGGNVMVMIDGLVQDATKGGSYQMPAYSANVSNLDKLLNHYGVERGFNFVMDKNSYETNSQQYGKMNMYWAPVLQKGQMPKKNIITNNLGFVIMLQNGSLNVSKAQENPDLKVTVLAKSSDESWTEGEDVMLNPMAILPPEPEKMKSEDLAVMLEGKFTSAFEKPPVVEGENANTDIVTTNHLSESKRPGKLFVIGTSYVTTYQLIDAKGSNPVAMFMMNVVDYMNGNEDLCEMRTKGLTINLLDKKSPVLAKIFQYFNEYGLAVLVAIVGLFVWKRRTARRKQINLKYNPNDTRTIVKEKKVKNEE